MASLDHDIQQMTSIEELQDLKLQCTHGGLAQKQNFPEESGDRGKEHWKQFHTIIDDAKAILDTNIGCILETELGFGAYQCIVAVPPWIG